jgi:hypothetical protein
VHGQTYQTIHYHFHTLARTGAERTLCDGGTGKST